MVLGYHQEEFMMVMARSSIKTSVEAMFPALKCVVCFHVWEAFESDPGLHMDLR